MNPGLLDLLACPVDAGALQEGPRGLRCLACQAAYPVVDGIPCLLTPELVEAVNRRGGLELPQDLARRIQERQVRDEESHRYDDIYPDFEYRHELDTYCRLLGARPGDTVLDVGAGTGRVTKEYGGRVGRLVCADFSPASLRRLRERPELRGSSLLAVVADAGALPLRDGSFDRIAALSLLCFLPGDELRSRFLVKLRRLLRPAGTLVISTYHHAAVKRLWALCGRPEGALKEGFHSQGRIHYRNETEAEFVAALRPHFEVQEVRGVCHRVPLLSRLSRRLSRGLDGALGRVAAARPWFATEIVARCRPR